jgi:CHAT domain-containing protein
MQMEIRIGGYAGRLKCVVATMMAALVFPISGLAAGEDARSLAGRVAEAWAIGDVAAISPLWSVKSVAAARRVRIDLEQTARIECHELKGVTIDSVTDGDGVATVRATIVRSESSRVEVEHLLISLRREGEAWRVADCVVAERALAKQIVSDPSRFDALLRDDPELMTRDLAMALADVASLGGVQIRPVEARAAAAALDSLAVLLDNDMMRSLAATAAATLADTHGDAARAQSLVTEALTLARRSGDAEVLMRALVVRARLYERSPNGYAQAVETSEEALRLVDRVTNRLLASFVVGNLGNLKLKQAKYAEAINYFQRAAAISTEIDDINGVMKTESSQGLILQIEGNHELALRRFERATALGANDPVNDAWRGQDFISIAQSYTALGRERESAEALRKAEELGRRSKAPIVIGETHRLRGSSFRRAHDYAAATRELEEALSVFEAAKRMHFIPGAMSELALTRLEAGDARDAVVRADRCATFSRNMNEDLAYIECRTFAGEAHRALGENDAALAAFRDAIDVSEERRRALVGDARQRAHFLERVISPYLDAADILADRGDVADALDMTERAKSRALLDILGGDVSHQQDPLTHSEEQREAELAAKLASLNRRQRDEKSKTSALSPEIAAARAEYESYQLVLDAAHPRRKALEGSVAVATPADVVPLLGASTAIVEYVVAADRARAFVVTAERGVPHVESIRLTAGGREIDRLVGRFTEALAHGDLVYRKDAQALYGLLMQPLEALLRGRKALCIIPDGSLWRLPFEALIDRKGRFVIESRACFYAPSISVFAQVTRGGGRPGAKTTLLAVGNPSLGSGASARLRGVAGNGELGPIKEAEEEVRALRSLYGAPHSRILLGKEATKQNVTGQMESFRVLHFATHAIFDEDNPLYSEVVLAESRDRTDDGLLAAWEIMRLNLRADIVVLSACETARGGLSAGEGIIGFTWALFVAGCPSSVVSEWKVDSASTKRLMVAFHRALLAAKDTNLAKAEALRTAKLSLLRDARSRHPFYWSAFVLVGSARSIP